VKRRKRRAPVAEQIINAADLAESRLVALESDLSRRNQMKPDESG